MRTSIIIFLVLFVTIVQSQLIHIDFKREHWSLNDCCDKGTTYHLFVSGEEEILKNIEFKSLYIDHHEFDIIQNMTQDSTSKSIYFTFIISNTFVIEDDANINIEAKKESIPRTNSLKIIYFGEEMIIPIETIEDISLTSYSY